MRKILLPSLLGIVTLLLLACGGAATAVPTNTAAPQATQPPPTAVPTATPAPQATDTPEPAQPAASGSDYSPELLAIAADRANGPGAIFVGDLNDLVGPAPTPEEGDADGIVPLDALEKHRFVYESDYYRSVIERARFTNPTPMTSQLDDPIIIQNACVNRALVFCKIQETFWGPNLEARTNGMLRIEMTSFPELGIAGPDSLGLVGDGTLDMVNIIGPYVAGELPELEIQYLFGLYTQRSQQYEATVDMLPDIEQLLIDETGGYPINVNWHNGDDIFLFTKKPLNLPQDVQDMKTRAFGTSISDWINGMGGAAQFLAFTEVYTALERGILEAGVTGGDAGYGQRWYEVTGYINGPLTSWPSSHNVINGEVWATIPADLQQIMKEEAAKLELEALRVGSIQNELGLQKNVDAGMTYVEFGPEMRAHSDNAVSNSVVPNWLTRIGGPGTHFAAVFNRAIGPVVGITIEPDGTITRQ